MKTPAATAGTSHTTSERSGFFPLLRSPAERAAAQETPTEWRRRRLKCEPAARKPSGAVTPRSRTVQFPLGTATEAGRTSVCCAAMRLCRRRVARILERIGATSRIVAPGTAFRKRRPAVGLSETLDMMMVYRILSDVYRRNDARQGGEREETTRTAKEAVRNAVRCKCLHGRRSPTRRRKEPSQIRRSAFPLGSC